MADVEQTAEQQLLGVLHVGVVGRAGLQAPEDRPETTGGSDRRFV